MVNAFVSEKCVTASLLIGQVLCIPGGMTMWIGSTSNLKCASCSTPSCRLNEHAFPQKKSRRAGASRDDGFLVPRNPLKLVARHVAASNGHLPKYPNPSGDLNPIEIVWARLRKDLAIREFEDLQDDKVITTLQFKQRVSQLLTSYGCVRPGKSILTWKAW